MHLAIVRHGKAEPDSASGRDEDRLLAPKGRSQARWLGERLAGEGFQGTPVLSSPASRAISTAEILARELGVEPETRDALMLGSGVTEVVRLLESCAQWERLVIVGHNPTFSSAASVLVGGVNAGGVHLRTGEAALCRVRTIEPGGAELLGLCRKGSS